MADINRYKILSAAIDMHTFTIADIVAQTGLKRSTVSSFFSRHKAYFEAAGSDRQGRTGAGAPVKKKRIAPSALPDVAEEIGALHALVDPSAIATVTPNLLDEGVFVPDLDPIERLVRKVKRELNVTERRELIDVAASLMSVEANRVAERERLGVAVDSSRKERLVELQYEIEWYGYDLDLVVKHCLGLTVEEITGWLYRGLLGVSHGDSRALEPLPSIVVEDFLRLDDVLIALSRRNEGLSDAFRIASIATMGAIGNIGVGPISHKLAKNFYLYCCGIKPARLLRALKAQYKDWHRKDEGDAIQLYRVFCGLEIVSKLPAECRQIMTWFHEFVDNGHWPVTILPAIASLWIPNANALGLIRSQEGKFLEFYRSFPSQAEFISTVPSASSESTLRMHWRIMDNLRQHAEVKEDAAVLQEVAAGREDRGGRHEDAGAILVPASVLQALNETQQSFGW